MTVRELRELLENLPPEHDDTRVRVSIRDGETPRIVAVYDLAQMPEPVVLLS